MATIDQRLLSLLGHELRAPVGVIGGYLAMLERPESALTPAQATIVEGARRAHHVAQAILADLSRLTASARESGVPTVSTVTIATLLEEARTAAAAQHVTLTVPEFALSLAVRADRSLTADALVAVATVVAREHGLGVTCATDVAPDAIQLRFAPADAASAGGALRAFDHLRAGMGLRLVVAVDHLRRIGGEVMDVMGPERPVGAVITLRRSS